MCFLPKKPQFYPKLPNMDLKQIHDLIKVVNKSNIGEISIEDKDGKVTIKQKEEKVTVTTAPAQMYTSGPAAPVAQAAPSAPTAAPAAPVASNLITIKSPMIGTFYRRASPDKPLMAEEGTEVNPGKVVCIIEAMKLFNEIESEVKGTIVKVLVEDASPVEYDQPLFLVEPA
ncbi:MAG: acetyl-CoA carboxylase biotin carboxyl carrier protein [Bacteroidota bacterium]